MVKTEEELKPKETQLKVIDCDVHNAFSSMDEFLPYLSDPWKDFVRASNMKSPTGGHPFFIPVGGGVRMDSWPETGGYPGSSHELLKKQVLDEYNMSHAILFPHSAYMLSAVPQDQWAIAMASAYNDWLIDQWLSKDARYKGSVSVALQDPEAAAREIDRVGQHPGMVQVGLGIHTPYRAYGEKFYHPVWEAAVRNNLVVTMHVSIGNGLYGTHPAGPVKNFPELQCLQSLTAQQQMASMVFGGVFEKFPDLKVAFVECGFAWIPHMLYTMDTHWKSARREVPWVKRFPSEYVREHMWFGTQPMIASPTPKEILQIIQMIGEDRMLFASDYPHWEFDNPFTALKQLPVDLQKKILYDNPKTYYGFSD